MKTEITLSHYLRLGGKLEKVNWSEAYSDYGDKNQFVNIISYEDSSQTGGHDTPLFNFKFSNGVTHRYAITWIKVKVDMVLSENYL